MIGVITLSSDFEMIEQVKEWKWRFFAKCSFCFTAYDMGINPTISSIKRNIDEENISGIVILLATGGTEALANEIIKSITLPIIIWGHSCKNSLAATMEIIGYYRDKRTIKLIYGDGDNPKLTKQLKEFSEVCILISQLQQARFGIIGKPSDWLLLAKDTATVPFKTSFVEIEPSLVTKYVQEIKKKAIQSKLRESWDQFNTEKLADIELDNAYKVNLAIQRIILENELSAITIRCFDLLEEKYTACMALSHCNDTGVPAACESDLHAMIAMYMAKVLTKQSSWMANPSSISIKENTVTFAHCTIPLNMIAGEVKPVLKTHMESGLSVAIESALQKRDVTIFRLGGDYDEMLIARGEIIETNMRDPRLCRTQAIIHLQEDVEKWVESSCGNHQIIVYGDITSQLKLFCELQKIKVIEID